MQNIGYVKVNNLPSEHERYVVARLNDGELWFWGSWADKETAEKAANQFENGRVIEDVTYE